MTYTNGYQSPNTGASTYSPFNRTAGAQQPQQYEGYPSAVPGNAPHNASSPGMATDSFVGPASHEDIDSLSGNIDNKIAQIRQAFSGGAPTAPAAPAAPQVSDADIQWALQLEQKVKGGQTPTPEETARYENIAQRLTQAQPTAPAAPAAPQVSDADIQWALQLEQKVKGGQTPTPEETARYENIAQRLTQPQAQPTAPATPAAPQVSDADIQWALQLEQKVKGGQAPTPEETARYENIAQRLSAQQSGAQQPQAPTQQPNAPRNWSDWSKPFTVPAAPTMPLPISGPGGQAHLNVPTSLRGAPQTPPAAMLNQAPGAPTASAGMPSQADIDWALQLEQRVNQQQYQPTPQETTRYQNIAQGIAAAKQQGATPQAMPPAGMPAQADIDWALQLEQRVNQQQYQPTAQETARYQNIAQGIAAAQQPAPPPAQAPTQPVQPVSVPQQFPTQAPQQPAAQPAQAGTNLPPGLSQQELNWALQLEEKVKQGHQPNPQELAAYENIAQRLQQANTQASQQPQYTAPPAQAPGAFQQNGQQWVTPQGAPPTQLVPQNYPHVQQGTPQALVQPPPLPQYRPPVGQAQPGVPQQQPGRPPQYVPGQPPAQQQAPGFMDKAKAAWNMLWS